jgi:predicted nuclease of predicted toxin-antitoxin system
LKLLLDEHFPRRLAEVLRDRGHDVVAVTESQDLRGLADAELFAHASVERRALVTQNVADFSVLLQEAALTETEHFGVIFVPRRVWSSIRDLQPFADLLDGFLAERPAEDALRDTAAWIGSPAAQPLGRKRRTRGV